MFLLCSVNSNKNHRWVDLALIRGDEREEEMEATT